MTLFLIFCVLQIADAATTFVILNRGIGNEANPVMLWLMEKLGVINALLCMKTALIVLVYQIPPSSLLGPTLMIVDTFYAGVVLNNLLILIRRK